MQWDELFSEVREYQPGQVKLDLPTGGGVYLLTDEQDRMIQLASAADLRRAVLNRLAGPQTQEITPPQTEDIQPAQTVETPCETQPPEAEPAIVPGTIVPGISRRRADLSQIVRHIRWQPTHSVFEATYEYYRIARVILPDAYLDNVAFGPAWFVHADVGAATPRITVSKWVCTDFRNPPGRGRTGSPGMEVFSGDRTAMKVALGPFATQSDANRFVQVLEDVFDLCRYVHIIEQAPHGQACAYFEMGRCPAPCNGSIPMQQYRDTMATALRFAMGERDEARREWEGLMREAARTLEFEKAAAIKQRMDRAQDIEHAAYRFVRPMQDFSWLIVQRGGGRTRVKPFFVRRGWIEAGEIVKLKDLEQAVPGWLERMRRDVQPDEIPPPDQRSEHIWLASQFLFRRERIGLFLHVNELPAASELAEQIRHAFKPVRPSDEPDATGISPPAEE